VLRATPHERAERIVSGGVLCYAYDFRKWEVHTGEELVTHRKMLEERHASGQPIAPHELFWLPREEGLAWWNRDDVKFYLGDWAFRTVVAYYDMEGLDGVFRRMHEDPRQAADGLSQVDSPRAAPLMARLARRASKDEQSEATDWLLKFAETAADALVPRAVGEHGDERDDAEEALRMLDFRGKGDVVRRVADSYGAEVQHAVAEVLANRALKKPKKLPAQLNPSKLPPIQLREGGELEQEETKTLLLLLQVSPPELVETYESIPDEEDDGEDAEEEAEDDMQVEDPLELGESFRVHLPRLHPAFVVARAACDASSLDAFALALLDVWKAVPKEKWLLFACGALGGDGVARAIGELVLASVKQKRRPQALLGLDVLMHLGSERAKKELAAIAGRKELKQVAHEAGYRLRRLA
jgi:hypothetical protein